MRGRSSTEVTEEIWEELSDLTCSRIERIGVREFRRLCGKELTEDEEIDILMTEIRMCRIRTKRARTFVKIRWPIKRCQCNIQVLRSHDVGPRGIMMSTVWHKKNGVWNVNVLRPSSSVSSSQAILHTWAPGDVAYTVTAASRCWHWGVTDTSTVSLVVRCWSLQLISIIMIIIFLTTVQATRPMGNLALLRR
jgi:hypothetical protein